MNLRCGRYRRLYLTVFLLFSCTFVFLKFPFILFWHINDIGESYNLLRLDMINKLAPDVNLTDLPDAGNSAFWEPYFIRKAKQNLDSHGYLVIAISNDGDYLLTLNFIKSLQIQGYTKFLIGCLDVSIFKRLYHHSYTDKISLVPKSWLNTKLTSNSVSWETPEYNDITKAKTLIVHRLLWYNFTVFLNDVDLVWLSPHITDNLSLLSPQRSELIGLRDETMINSGFYVVKPTVTMKKIFSLAVRLQNLFSGMHDQYALNNAIWYLSLTSSSTIHRLNMLEYANGHGFFHAQRNNKSGVKPLVVHANYLVGNEAKIEHLKDAGLWFLPNNTE